ncbi:MAG TPA: hypothetical protein VGJ39_13720 [Vicinamibacterales bacterium]
MRGGVSSVVLTGVAIVALGSAVGVVPGQLEQRGFVATLDHPAIEYRARPTRDPVAQLNRLIDEGKGQLKFEGTAGYVRSVLNALNVPIESQIVVFSKTSVQAARITPRSPRTLFFNDSVVVGWVRGGFVELAALDPQQGVIFYTLQQGLFSTPRFSRETRCLSCHESYSSLDVAGMLMKSVFPSRDGTALYQFGSFIPDHRTPFEQRWGGWYVTGGNSAVRHMGNAILTNPDGPVSPETPEPPHAEPVSIALDQEAYLSPYSDIAALMVFDHQRHMTNLLIRVGWEFRVAAYQRSKADDTTTPGLLRDMTTELVDYLLFVDEAPLPARVQSTSGFAETFRASGPVDRKGRSLRQLDLDRRLLRYPCSYMIYTEAFDGLPVAAKEAIYARMWQVLSGEDRGKQYARLSLVDRQAIVEILRDTKKGLPGYFQPVIR